MDVLRAQVEGGVEKALTGVELLGPGVPREGYELRHGGTTAGKVTSGTFSPSLGKGIAMAYVDPALKGPGTELEVVIRGRGVAARVVKPPFYKKELLNAATKGH